MRHREPVPDRFWIGVRNGCLLSIPLWAVIIFGIIKLKETFSHG
jgi:hypothetical protein